MGQIQKTISVMTAPNGRGIIDEITIVGCDIRLVRRSTRNYEMVIMLAPDDERTMEFTTAGGDIMLTLVPFPNEPPRAA